MPSGDLLMVAVGGVCVSIDRLASSGCHGAVLIEETVGKRKQSDRTAGDSRCKTMWRSDRLTYR
jgi:hypothetical protein